MSYQNEDAYGIAVLAMRLILRAARESEDDAVEELEALQTALGHSPAFQKLLGLASPRMNDLPVRLAFAFVVAEKRNNHSWTNLRFEFVKRIGAPTYQGFCVEHDDCKKDYKLSMACDDRKYEETRTR